MKAETVSTPDRSQSQALAALNKAALAIGQDLELDQTLQHIVDSARELVSARYAALGVFNDERELETFVFSGLTSEQAAEIQSYPKGRGLLGAVLDGPDPIRVSDVSSDPRSEGIPPGHPPLTSFLGVPFTAGDEIQGNLYLTNKQGGEEFTDADVELITIFASQSAVAIKNARLYEEVGRLAIIEERSRIGMDLHDGVIQSIYGVGLTLETVQMVVEDKPDEARRLLKQSIAALNDAIQDIRNFILDLRPRRFEGDLAAGIARIIREFEANAMVEVEVRLPEDLSHSLPASVSQAVYLTAQEALANIARHSRAASVSLGLEQDPDSIRLSVSDDGVGFDLQQQDQIVGHGLANMRARAEELGGDFTIESETGRGTSIRLQLPLRE
ncbi:MAG: GAF domain-containing sensor histidine kinase [Chloroflexi bacterium]|nr:GAF domain-containing sensor histidine kinase [Chloroflexota bacterium]MDK1045666.1 GAF domain-containing sensor histidine kinase [Anaerolineales bacterium]MCH8094608.1 GAF domain-containing sensor histidine kinase [Chloroflexota bacterium]MCH8338901.1 GAF domain-containing sensor histidine kinase [Chloroflexota bacterium]MCH8340408.1 GAF domain-containing sensor histidine kinase [Chloroflexota bacterium]